MDVLQKQLINKLQERASKLEALDTTVDAAKSFTIKKEIDQLNLEIAQLQKEIQDLKN